MLTLSCWNQLLGGSSSAGMGEVSEIPFLMVL